jgi:hypothetical protein
MKCIFSLNANAAILSATTSNVSTGLPFEMDFDFTFFLIEDEIGKFQVCKNRLYPCPLHYYSLHPYFFIVILSGGVTEILSIY